jgi:hypothetical protein
MVDPYADVIEELSYEIILAQKLGKPELIPGIEHAIEIVSRFQEVDDI